jgi:hypothetical protein
MVLWMKPNGFMPFMTGFDRRNLFVSGKEAVFFLYWRSDSSTTMSLKRLCRRVGDEFSL